MKFLVKVTLPIEEGNAAILDGSIMEKMQKIMEDTQPEAVYFAAENGQRTQYLIVDIDDATEMPKIAEPWWLSFNADVDVTPVFTLADMEQLGPALGEIVHRYG